MKNYYEITTFIFKGKLYRLYLDDKNKKFFTSVGFAGDENYITIEEFVELLNLYNKNYGVNCIEESNNQIKKKKKKSFVPRVIVGGVLTVLTSATLMAGISYYNSCTSFQKSYNEHLIAAQSSTSDSGTDYSKYYDGGEADEEFELDTYVDLRSTTNNLFIYDMDYIDMAISYDEKDLDDFIETNYNVSIDN